MKNERDRSSIAQYYNTNFKISTLNIHKYTIRWKIEAISEAIKITTSYHTSAKYASYIKSFPPWWSEEQHERSYI